jgi:hypothetical protein
MLDIRRREFKRYRPGNTRRRNALHKAAAILLFLVLSVARDSRALEPSPPQMAPPDLHNCLVTKHLLEEARTESLPDGVRPIRINQRCFDKSYGLAVSNKCDSAIRIQVEAGTGVQPANTLCGQETVPVFAAWRRTADAGGCRLAFYPSLNLRRREQHDQGRQWRTEVLPKSLLLEMERRCPINLEARTFII